MRLPIPGGNLPLLAVRYALLEWARAAELSCDRAAALTTRDPRVVCSMLMAMSGGAAAGELNLDAFERQAMEYTEGGAGLDRLQRMLSDLQLDHGMPVKRVHELMAWVRSGDYDPIVGGDLPAPRRRAEGPDRRGRRCRRALLRRLPQRIQGGGRARLVRRAPAQRLAAQQAGGRERREERRAGRPAARRTHEVACRPWTSRPRRSACWAA